MKRLALLPAVLLTGCTAARLSAAPLPPPPSQRGATTVVIEPFFEQAGWQTTYRTEHMRAYPTGGMGMFGSNPYYGSYPMDVTYQREIVDKPVVARTQALAAEHQTVIQEIQRLRPEWQVMSTSGLATATGRVELVRTIVGDTQLSESDRMFKNWACGLGLAVPAPFLMIHETQRVTGGMIRYEAEAEVLKGHLLRYPTQPDSAVDTRGLVPATQPYALDVAYEEGMFAPEPSRDRVVVTGFAQQLALAIVALVEGAPR